LHAHTSLFALKHMLRVSERNTINLNSDKTTQAYTLRGDGFQPSPMGTLRDTFCANNVNQQMYQEESYEEEPNRLGCCW
jgi:hypothetical protein